jgi:hypothetical protein
MSEKLKHFLYAIEQDFLEDGYHARCDCGWVSSEEPTQQKACEAFEEHARTAE